MPDLSKFISEFGDHVPISSRGMEILSEVVGDASGKIDEWNDKTPIIEVFKDKIRRVEKCVSELTEVMKQNNTPNDEVLNTVLQGSLWELDDLYNMVRYATDRYDDLMDNLEDMFVSAYIYSDDLPDYIEWTRKKNAYTEVFK